MISSKTLIQKANDIIDAGSLTSLELTQVTSINSSLNNSHLTVASLATLPSAADNTGRIIYVDSEEKHYFSNGVEWSSDFSSEITITGYIAYSWASGTNGRLGDNTTISKSSPVTVVGGITNWAQVSAGGAHSLGVTDSGIAYAWGSNGSDRLGDASSPGVDRSSPVTVVGGITNWAQVSAGGAHSFGVTDAGIAYGWGRGDGGQLGDDTTNGSNSPVTTIGGITNWAQVSAGLSAYSGHSLGITTAGVAYGWGVNSTGVLGDGTVIDRSSPVTIVGGITNWAQVSAGETHSLGVTVTGIAYGWGGGAYQQLGQIGDGTTIFRSSPVTVVGGITDWAQVSAGGAHSLGITDSGIAYAWGSNGNGKLGDSSSAFIERSSPVTVVGGITNWAQVSAGREHSLGITDAGIGYAWGSNTYGRLGDDTGTNRSSPVTVAGGITNWAQVSAGGDHSVALVSETRGFS